MAASNTRDRKLRVVPGTKHGQCVGMFPNSASPVGKTSPPEHVRVKQNLLIYLHHAGSGILADQCTCGGRVPSSIPGWREGTGGRECVLDMRRDHSALQIRVGEGTPKVLIMVL